MAGTGIQIDKNELRKIMEEGGGKGSTIKKKESLTPRDIFIRVVLTIFVIAYYVLLFFGEQFLPKDNRILLSLDVFSDIEKPIQSVRMLSLAILTLSLSKILRIFIVAMAKNSALTKRTGVAVIELLANLVKYAAILILIFLILSVAGVDTAELLAGLGILALVLGMGVTNLVEDIVAGVFIIAERLFDVGDVVVVNEFRGTVISIGIRSTQIEDEGGDILILRNSAIEDLVNMTNRLSFAICDIPVAPEESLERIEEILEPALKDMGTRIPEIEKGPFYLGLSEMDADAMIMTFVAACHEDYKYGIQRKLNREIKLLFDKNGIKLGDLDDDDDD